MHTITIQIYEGQKAEHTTFSQTPFLALILDRVLSKSLLETNSRQTPQIKFEKSCHHMDRIRILLKISSLHYNTMLYIFTLSLLHPSITTASHKSTLMETRWKRKPTKALCRIPIVGTEFGLDLNRGGSRAYQGGSNRGHFGLDGQFPRQAAPVDRLPSCALAKLSQQNS